MKTNTNTNTKTSILTRIIGLVMIGVGILIGYGEYLIFTTISGIAGWLGGVLGFSDSIIPGLTLLLHIPVLGVIIGLAFICLLLLYFGYLFVMDK